LLEVTRLEKSFRVRSSLLGRVQATVRAVDGVDLVVGEGETVGCVGESGCGKTTLGRAILRLIEPDAGSIRFAGRDVRAMGGGALRALRREMQIIFQDPFASLNPRMKVEELVGEALTVHGLARGRARMARVTELLERVGLDAASMNRYPHEFSGGQRQRIGIARALALGPRFVVCDEATSALDVSVQAQIINLLESLGRELGISYLFISHDLGVVRHVSDRVLVMYLGRIVEEAPTEALFETPRHPYTRALLSAIPVPDPDLASKRKRIVLEGDLPSPDNPPPGCPFHTRCPDVMDVCRSEEPPWKESEPAAGHRYRCHLD